MNKYIKEIAKLKKKRQMTRGQLFLFIVLVVGAFALYKWRQHNYSQRTNLVRPVHSAAEDEDCIQRVNYSLSCLSLFNELRHPAPSSIHRPPLLEIPKELFDEFTQHGEMIYQYWYINDVYNDSTSTNSTQIVGEIKESMMKGFLYDLNSIENMTYFGTYGDVMLPRMMAKKKSELRDQSLVVVGTILPWIEAVGVKFNMSQITTLDYTRMRYENERNGQLKWQHVFDFLDEATKKNRIEQFDNAASFSSVEHSGMGRYGDPLDPNGDIKAVRQMHCMIKPGGLMFLGLPTSDDNKSYVVYNAHRYYGVKRLTKLLPTEDWELLETAPKYAEHQVYVARKKDNFC